MCSTALSCPPHTGQTAVPARTDASLPVSAHHQHLRSKADLWFRGEASIAKAVARAFAQWDGKFQSRARRIFRSVLSPPCSSNTTSNRMAPSRSFPPEPSTTGRPTPRCWRQWAASFWCSADTASTVTVTPSKTSALPVPGLISSPTGGGFHQSAGKYHAGL